MSARYLGDFRTGNTIRGRFNSVNTSGVPTTLAGSPALAVYKDGNTTESTSGVTLTVDFDARTGLHTYAIDTSADGTFYSAGSDFTVALTAGTVSGSSVVGMVVGAFSLQNRSALMPTTSGRTVTLDTSGNVVLQDGSLTAAKIAAGALNGKGDWSTYAGGDTAGTTTLLGRLTNTRATNLDNLNIGGNAASQADILALNQSASRRVLLVTVPQYERPESGSITFQLEARTYDGDGAATNADSAPTLTATGVSGTSYAANVSASSNPATGVYRWTYTVSDLHTLEQIRFDLSATLGGSAFTIATFSQVVDFVAAEWTTTDASRLQAIFDKLPSSSFLAGSGVSGGGVTLATNQGHVIFESVTANENFTAILGFEGNLTGRVLGDSATAFVGAGVRAELGANVVNASVLAADAAQEIADAVLSRGVASVEGSAPEHSLATVILASLESSRSGSTWTIKRTDGTTTHYTKTITTDAAAQMVTGVA